MADRPAPLTDSPPRRKGGGSRSVVILVASLAVIAVAASLVIALGGSGGSSPPGESPGEVADATAAYADLSLVPVLATAVPSGAPSPTVPSLSGASSVQPSASPGSTASQGIRAKRIRIERLDIDLRIIEGDGIDAPIGKAAHYPGSAWPGGGSNIYVYGHAREGMFLSLWKARVGDVLVLDLADGTTRRYIVDEVLPKVPWDAVKYTRPTPTEQLTLQTSTSYHPTSPRFIVIAYPAP